MRVNPKIKIDGIKTVEKKFNSVYKGVDLTAFGEKIKDRMIQIIDDNRVRDIKQPEERYQGKYTKHIKDVLDVVLRKRGIAIGDIQLMNKEVPYWRVVNDGGYVPPKTTGVFLGGPGSSLYFTPEGAKIEPKSAIPAMEYIEKTLTWVKQHAPKVIKQQFIKAFKDYRQQRIIKIDKYV